jgi:hypothetical protein
MGEGFTNENESFFPSASLELDGIESDSSENNDDSDDDDYDDNDDEDLEVR